MFRKAGRNLLNVFPYMSGPVPKMAVFGCLKLSTAIDHPAEKGSMAMPEVFPCGSNNLMDRKIPTNIIIDEEKRIGFRIQFLE